MRIDFVLEQQRQEYLDALYIRSGRTDGLYTGLFQSRLAELVAQDMEALSISNPEDGSSSK